MASLSNRLRDTLVAHGIECMYTKNGLTTIWYSADGKTEYTASERRGTRFTLKIIHKGPYTLKQVVDAIDSRTNDTTLGNDGAGRTNDGVAGHGTCYERMFGTPERAARTLADLQTCSLGFDLECDECTVYSLCHEVGACHDRDALLEWLRGDAE